MIVSPINVGKVFASTFFMPDSDSAALLQIALTNAEGIERISKLVNIGKETATLIKESTEIAEDYHWRMGDALTYIGKVKNLPSESSSIKDFALLADYMEETKSTYDSRSRLTLGHDVLNESYLLNQKFFEENNKRNTAKNKALVKQFKRSQRVRKSKHGSAITAQNTAYMNLSLQDINDLLTVIASNQANANMFSATKSESIEYEKFEEKKQWGMIKSNVSFESYKRRKLEKLKIEMLTKKLGGKRKALAYLRKEKRQKQKNYYKKHRNGKL
jgi:hypothetical protein